ncbi:MAG: response regulator [Syntrophobacteraceae bacterium]|nr:response regulator [Syntrophobacteraceae bacterium]
MRIIDDILDLSKIEAGGMALEHTVFELHRTIEEAVVLFAGKAANKGVALNVSIAGNVPRSVCGDPVRLRQILVNLVGNGVKFTEKGEVTVRVVRENPHGPKVSLLFEVRDTGIGIPPEVQARLFNPFTQADGSTTRKFGGTGLGLAISKHLVELMGGTIGVESKAGEGSNFWFRVCLEPTTLDESEAGMQKGVVSRKPPDNPFAGLRVLVVEDNPVNRELVHMMLSTLGSAVDLAENGSQAVEALQREDYDFVLMDCQMPVVDGFEATRLIREHERRTGKEPTVIIALTASAMEGDRAHCIDAGMNDYLAKPFRPKDIKALLARWLAR